MRLLTLTQPLRLRLGIFMMLALSMLGLQQANAQYCQDGFCPSSIDTVFLGNRTFGFSIPTVCPDVDVKWIFSDGTDAVNGPNAITHFFLTPGTHTVIARFIDYDCPNAPQQSELSINVVTGGTNQLCNSGIQEITRSCEQSSFFCFANGEISWLLNNEPTGISGNEFIYAMNGSGTTANITAQVTSETCGNSTETLEFFQPICANACSLPITVTHDCFDLQLSLPGIEPSAPVLWTINGVIFNSTAQTVYTVSDFGEYIITATYWTWGCTSPEPVNLTSSTGFGFTSCATTNCPTSFTASTAGCQLQSFEVNSTDVNEVVVWDFGNSVQETGGASTQHRYNVAGTYNVCANITSSECNVGTTICTSVDVASCANSICPSQITASQSAVRVTTFNIPGALSNETVLWNFGDGNTEFGLPTITHTYATTGNYTVTASFFDPDCATQNVVLTFNGTLLGLSGFCPTAVSYTEGSECGSYNYSVNAGSPLLGTFNWNFGDGILASGVNVSHQYGVFGNISTTLTFTSTVCPSQTFNVLIAVPDCTPPDICPENIAVTVIDTCGTYQLELTDAGDYSYIQWAIDDGTNYQGSSVIEHDFALGGMHSFCVNVISATCPDGVALCDSALIRTCNWDCTLELLLAEEKCGGRVTIGANGVPPGVNVVWTVDGQPSGAGTFLKKDILPGTHEICGTYSFIDCFFPVTDCITVNIDSCEDVVCPTELLPDQSEICDEYNLSVAMDEAFETVVWTINNDTIDAPLSFTTVLEAGVNTICADYASAHCPEGVQLCVDYNTPQCGVCPTQISFLSIGCQDIFVGVADPTIPALVYWDFGNGDAFYGAAEQGYNYATGGYYTITVTYSSIFCPEGVTLRRSLFIQNCENTQCEIVLIPADTTCSSITFDSFAYPFNVPIYWSLDGVDNGTGDSKVISNLTPGFYDLCVSLTSEVCPDGYEICANIEFPDCTPNACPSFVDYTPTAECGVYDLVIPEAGFEPTVTWNFPEGSVVGGFEIQHEFILGGSTNFTVNYTGSDCPAGTVIPVTINLPICPRDCSISLGAPQQSCGTVSIAANVFPNGGPEVNWYVDGNLFTTSPSFLEVLSEGPHEICAEIGGAYCNAIVGDCIDVVADTCFEAVCPTSIEYTAGEACGEYIFTIGEGDALATVTWNFPNIVFGGDSINYTFPIPGLRPVSAYYESPQCYTGVNLSTSVNFPQCEENCFLDVAITSADCENISATANAPAGVTVQWFINNQSAGAGTSQTFNVSQGNYNICAAYSRPQCPSQPLECVLTTVPACPEVICASGITINPGSSCGLFDIAIVGGEPGATVNWVGEPIAANIQSATLPLAENTEYLFIAEYSSENCPNGTIVSVNYTTQSCADPCTISISDYLETCGSISAIATVPAGYSASWTVDGTDAGTGNILDYSTTAGMHTVCASYTDEACGGITSTCVEMMVIECPTCEIALNSATIGDITDWNYQFELIGDPTPISAQWSINNVSYGTFSNQFSHQFLLPGNYDVCATINRQYCGQETICTSVSISPDCDQQILMNFSNADLGVDLGAVSYILYNSNNEVVINGTVTFNAIGEIVTETLCATNDCYHLEVNTLNNFDPRVRDYVWLQGNPGATPSYVIVDENTFIYYFGVNSDCAPQGDCSADFVSYNTGNALEASFVSSIDPGNGVGLPINTYTTAWDFGNGGQSSDENPLYVYSVNGNYNACLTITTYYGCQDVVCHPVEIFNSTTNCTGSSIGLSWQGTNNSDVLMVTLTNVQTGEVFETLALQASSEAQGVELCIPFNCIQMNFSSDNMSGTSLTASAFSGALNLGDITLNNANDEAVLQLRLSNDCPTNVDESNISELLLYPNPTNSDFVIAKPGTGMAQLNVFDQTGKRIMQTQIFGYSNRIAIDQLASGIYTVQVIENDQVSQKQLMVVR